MNEYKLLLFISLIRLDLLLDLFNINNINVINEINEINGLLFKIYLIDKKFISDPIKETETIKALNKEGLKQYIEKNTLNLLKGGFL